MTFLGTIPAPLRSIIKETAAGWPVGDFYVGCSGNFTIERTLRDTDPGFVAHSNDVSIYTTALGRWLHGDPVELSLTGEYEDALDFVAPSLDGGTGSLAALMLLTHFAPDVGKPHMWFVRNVEAHRKQWDQLHSTTVEKLEANRFPIGSFDCMDVREWLDTKVPDDATLVSFPPFDKGGYEKLYERLDDIFDWPRPTYDLLDEDGVQAVVDKITDRPNWLMGLLHERPDLAEHQVGYVKVADAARPFYVYARGSKTATRYVSPVLKTEPVKAPRLTRRDVIGPDSTLELRPLKPAQFLALRAQYLNPRIRVGSGNLNYPLAVVVDGKIAGAICYGMWSSGDAHAILLTTDFAVAPHDYPKLSKLVVMAALSKEGQRVLERGWARRCHRVQTAVFTNGPVSMKYRGVMACVDRQEQDEGSQFKFKLTYAAEPGKWTLAEALATWLTKWGDRRPHDTRGD